jgi:hypothetical protein
VGVGRIIERDTNGGVSRPDPVFDSVTTIRSGRRRHERHGGPVRRAGRDPLIVAVGKAALEVRLEREGA